MAEYKQLSDGRPDGVQLGKSATDKIAFFGGTPVVQQTTVTAVATTGATSTSPFGFTEAQANAIIAGINGLKLALDNLDLTA
jgi:hypothetical protein